MLTRIRVDQAAEAPINKPTAGTLGDPAATVGRKGTGQDNTDLRHTRTAEVGEGCLQL